MARTLKVIVSKTMSRGGGWGRERGMTRHGRHHSRRWGRENEHLHNHDMASHNLYCTVSIIIRIYIFSLLIKSFKLKIENCITDFYDWYNFCNWYGQKWLKSDQTGESLGLFGKFIGCITLSAWVQSWCFVFINSFVVIIIIILTLSWD